jgi:hypothetical protein
MAYKKINKVVYLDDEEMVWCSKEKDYIPAVEFELDKNGNFKMWCIKCATVMADDQRQLYVDCAKARKDFDTEQSKMLLRSIGYDTDGDFSVHEQFLIKHNLVK